MNFENQYSEEELRDYIKQNLFESFIREFKNKINWHYISRYQNLSENFIEEFQHKVDWGYISEYQNLFEEFIINFKIKFVGIS